MIPPTLFEVIQHIPQWEFNDFKGDRCKENQFEIPTDDGLEEPPEEVGQCKHIEESVVDVLVGIGMLVIN